MAEQEKMGVEPENLLTPTSPGSFYGQKEFATAVQNCIVKMCNQGANTLILCDTDFSLWPLDQLDVLDALRRWANSTSNQRVLIMVAATYAIVEQQHSAWVRWRKMWDHRVKCWQIGAQSDPNLHSIFWSSGEMVKVFEKGRCIGRVSTDKQQLSQTKSQLDEYIRQSDPALPASTVGLW